MSWICPYCGYENFDDYPQCGYCGNRVILNDDQDTNQMYQSNNNPAVYQNQNMPMYQQQYDAYDSQNYEPMYQQQPRSYQRPPRNPYMDHPQSKPKTKRKKNKCLVISFILGFCYCIYIVSYFGNAVSSSQGMRQVGAGIATALVTPHMILAVLATIFNGIGWDYYKPRFALAGAILYCCAMVVFIPYFMFVIIQMILSFVGYSQLKKANQEYEYQYRNS